MNTVFVLKTPDVASTLAFFEELGLVFQTEIHGTGPVHYACEQNGRVFEIYPSKDGGTTTKFFD
jgi:hypothetical protein